MQRGRPLRAGARQLRGQRTITARARSLGGGWRGKPVGEGVPSSPSSYGAAAFARKGGWARGYPFLGRAGEGRLCHGTPKETTKKRWAGFAIRPGSLSPKGSGPWAAFCQQKSRLRLTARQLPRIDGSPRPKGAAQRRDGAEGLRAGFETSCYRGGFLGWLLHDRAAAPLPSEGKAKKALLPPGCLPSNKMPGDHNGLG